MNEVTGGIVSNAETGMYDIVMHNANCQNTLPFATGVAGVMARAWPEIIEADNATEKGDINKLGNYTSTRVTRGDVSFVVYNLYCQFRYGYRSEQNFDYNALDSVLRKIAADLGTDTKRILIPLIGSGSGGGRWRKTKAIINNHLGHHHVTLARL